MTCLFSSFVKTQQLEKRRRKKPNLSLAAARAPRFPIGDVAESIELPPAAALHDLLHLGPSALDTGLGGGQAEAQTARQFLLRQPFVHRQDQRRSMWFGQTVHDIFHILVKFLP